MNDGDPPSTCEHCGLQLEMVPDQAGAHLAVRLDCIVHGPQLMWTPFGDDEARQRPAMEWSRAGLEAAGFEGFVRFADLKAAKVPVDPGVYVVLRPGATPPVFLERTVAGYHDGKDQSAPTWVLKEKWVSGAEVVYIGRAEARKSGRALRSRLAEYRRLGEGKDSPHRGGLYVWQLQDHAELLVCWKTLPNEMVRAEETRLIAEFVSAYGRWPFANRKD